MGVDTVIVNVKAKNKYQAYRAVGCDPITSIFGAFLNTLQGIPEGWAGILSVTIKYDEE